MNKRIIFAVCLLLPIMGYAAEAANEVPADFPVFNVPNHDQEMKTLRDLYYLHYPGSGPKATLWDEWLTGPSLWPAVETGNQMENFRNQWASVLASRRFDAEGYVVTNQHNSIAHQDGWPFPFWKQGENTWGWHFSLEGVPNGWHGTEVKKQDGWILQGGLDNGIDSSGWKIELKASGSSIEAPTLSFDSAQSPFIQLRWKAEGLEKAQPYLEWKTKEEDYSPLKRFYFEPAKSGGKMLFTMIPVYQSPRWKGTITGLRIQWNNPNPSGSLVVQALFNQYDTRHNINNQNYILGCYYYFNWTRDLNFLRQNINQMRLAMAYIMKNLGGLENKYIVTPYPGHNGRSGLEIKDGKKIIHSGQGIGNNYWDILPMGYKDTYATMHYYCTLLKMAELEDMLKNHPEWNIPVSVMQSEPEFLRNHAKDVKETAGKLFWNPQTGRFVCGIDVDGKSYDYGFTFINCEAVYYNFANEEQAKSILAWLDGKRDIAGDTSIKEDIYHWRFAPRATTKRNLEYYGWFWNSPESIPWGGQVQDGGAVLGFSYHDLMARLKTGGADNAWARLKEIIAWFDEVQAAGGYREYYKDGKHGTTLQGGGTAGGLGLDAEFFESVMVPQVMLEGFLGFFPLGDGFAIQPSLPSSWPSLEINRIHYHNVVLTLKVDAKTIHIDVKGSEDAPSAIRIPAGKWTAAIQNQSQVRNQKIDSNNDNACFIVPLQDGMSIDLNKE